MIYRLLHGSGNYLHEKLAVVRLIFLHKTENQYFFLFSSLYLKSTSFIFCFQVEKSFTCCFFSFGTYN